MRSGARNKGAHGARKLPLDTMREALADGKVYSALGVVRKFDGETAHYELDGEDVLVDVEIMPNGERALCRLACGAGPGLGLWFVPPEGTEVAVLVPQGDLEADPVVVGCLSSGDVPDGLTTSNWVIVVPAGGQLLVHDGSAGSAQALATKADLQAHKDWIDAAIIQHTHSYLPGPGSAAPTATAVIVAPTPPTAPSPSGTSVLKAK